MEKEKHNTRKSDALYFVLCFSHTSKAKKPSIGQKFERLIKHNEWEKVALKQDL